MPFLDQNRHVLAFVLAQSDKRRYNYRMRSERYARLRAGILAGIVASTILGFVIWLYGYITGERLAFSLLSIIAVGVGLISGAHTYVSNVEHDKPQDEVLAELEELSQGKALGKSPTVASNKQRNGRKAV